MGFSTRAAGVGESDSSVPHRWQGFREQFFFLLKSASEILHAPQTYGRSFLIVTVKERKSHRMEHVCNTWMTNTLL